MPGIFTSEESNLMYAGPCNIANKTKGKPIMISERIRHADFSASVGNE